MEYCFRFQIHSFWCRITTSAGILPHFRNTFIFNFRCLRCRFSFLCGSPDQGRDSSQVEDTGFDRAEIWTPFLFLSLVLAAMVKTILVQETKYITSMELNKCAHQRRGRVTSRGHTAQGLTGGCGTFRKGIVGGAASTRVQQRRQCDSDWTGRSACQHAQPKIQANGP